MNLTVMEMAMEMGYGVTHIKLNLMVVEKIFVFCIVCMCVCSVLFFCFVFALPCSLFLFFLN